ncbi:MAG: LysR family transcriptional regulator, partial [Notoacmeibacter sp.]
MSSLDLDLLKAFAAIIDTGSFTRAGERLGLT